MKTHTITTSHQMTIFIIFPADCGSVVGPSGEYMIAPSLAPEEHDAPSSLTQSPLLTWCDQQSGAGGWTVVQRRSNGVEQFNRPWSDYEAGFGAPAGKLRAALMTLQYII
jgi:hypothetical protein